MMDLNLIKKLIKIVEQSEITEFSVQEGDLKLRISKNSNLSHQGHIQSFNEYQKQNSANQPVLIVPESQTASIDKKESKLHEIKSPIVGTFYTAPSPDADPYIQIGDIVSPGSILCIIEAMKLMNEIESDISGKIVKIFVDNASPVEYNQSLFLIETI
jgi:acetyl-CoA carboxylase biotin carboxyl carrier protein